MNKKIMIKDFNSFEESKINETFDIGGLFNGIVNFAGEGIRKTIKQKIAALLMERLGIVENSSASVMVQEVVDQIPIADYPKLITGENANVEYLAPLLAKALQEFIQRKGLDGIAQEIGIKPTGLIWSTIREGIQSEKGRKAIESGLISLFSDKSMRDPIAKDALSKLDPKDKELLANAYKDKTANATEQKPVEGGIASLFGSLFGSNN